MLYLFAINDHSSKYLFGFSFVNIKVTGYTSSNILSITFDVSVPPHLTCSTSVGRARCIFATFSLLDACISCIPVTNNNRNLILLFSFFIYHYSVILFFYLSLFSKLQIILIIIFIAAGQDFAKAIFLMWFLLPK